MYAVYEFLILPVLCISFQQVIKLLVVCVAITIRWIKICHVNAI